MADSQVIVRTGRLPELQTAEAALKKAEIPHHLQQESVDGMMASMPVAPVPSPGVRWTISVPSEIRKEALAVIDSLPFSFSANPDVWESTRSNTSKTLVRTLMWMSVAALILVIFLTWFRS